MSVFSWILVETPLPQSQLGNLNYDDEEQTVGHVIMDEWPS